jgi:hypothetical protein
MPEMTAEGTGVADLERQLEEMRRSRDYHVEQTRVTRGLLADATEARDKALADGARWLSERDEAGAVLECKTTESLVLQGELDAARVSAELAEHNLTTVMRREEATVRALAEAGVPAAVPTSQGITSTFPDDRVRWLASRATTAEASQTQWKRHALDQRTLLGIYNSVVQDMPEEAQAPFGKMRVGAVAAHLLNTEPESTDAERMEALKRFADILAKHSR